ncbi:general secretion pathway protein D [Hyphomonas polymorpha PS728]|uniref:General secretion pathway protein D n=1 Tax=Hyphomonas polymorpha PS728 TaxID=1280954 RepID=A0A062VJE8_9PROT|nr:secretin N-terminal domain-containing protein [Hyphomonas polymorpha]KDA00626.1 general secretion pathway protein D [Hyphomonas polymorpha PS728]
MTNNQNDFRRMPAWAFWAIGALSVTGCATGSDGPRESGSLLTGTRIGDAVSRSERSTGSSDASLAPSQQPTATQDRSNEITVPSVARTGEGGGEVLGGPEDRPVPESQTVDAVVPALAIPQFIDVVFGNMLGVPYVTGPGVAARTELVQLRSSGRMNSDDFVELVSLSLESYGLRVFAEDGVYQIVTDESLAAKMPRFIKSRSRADIPEELRPVVQFVELDAVAANEMESILRQAFPDKQALKIETNSRLNVLTLTGLPKDLDAAIAIIDQLDELAYAGSTAERFSPVFWSATQLAQEVTSLLEAEGWQASTNKAQQKPILIMPVEYSNDLFVFSRSPAGLARARFWLSELDRPTRRGNEPQVYVYDVENVDAELLSQVVARVMTGQVPASQAQMPETPSPGADISRATLSQPTGISSANGSIVVNRLSNQIVFTGTPTQYEAIQPLLRRMDRPPAEVMIEVTIAEITLTDDTQFGVEFFINNLGGNDLQAVIGNEGLGLGSVGTSIGVVTGNVEAALNFFAKNNLVNVLSTPRLTARSGGTAQIQVGQDVPIITSQRATDTQSTNNGTDILQSVDYRSTGILLSIEPIVFGNNRVDLAITQEVSTAVQTTTSQIASPTISNRSVTTQLSLEDGATAILGGLIQETTTRDETGAPILKDIPWVGNLFRNTTLSKNRTELIVLITAYVVRDGNEKRAFTDELVGRFNLTTSNPGNMDTYLGTDLRQ